MTPRRGRPIEPVPDPKHGPGRLAEELRRGRRQRGLTRPELAQKIDRSIATVQRAEAGHVRPPWPVVQAIAEACRLDLATVEALWKEACAPAPDRVDAPHLKLVHTPADLAAALRGAWLENGEPSVRQMERRAEARASEFTPLSRMSAWRIRERKQPTASLRQLHAYLVACDVRDEVFPAWTEAWIRIRRREEAAGNGRGVNRDTDVTGHASPDASGVKRLHRITAADAVAVMRRAGLQPIDPFPGTYRPWTAKCLTCEQVSRFRYASVHDRGSSCPYCARVQAA
ncbi:helix-turn-helix domain-containing protein [Streptomyces sp. NPDC001634]|uniref:helix-turn-helix domain-containing protein n=1 Tax=Streptomyces sp. NPDC001634 TaxID=3154390 RepID=UPI0033223DC5